MKPAYPHLTAPLRLRNTLLQSRFLYPTAQPHFLQGPEPYPADPVVSFYCSLAQKGAALIMFHDLANDYQRDMPGFDTAHFCMYDIDDKACQNYFTQLTQMVHFYGGRLCTSLMLDLETDYMVNEPGKSPPAPFGPGGGSHTGWTGDGEVEFFHGAVVGPEGKFPDMGPPGKPKTRHVLIDDAMTDEYADAVIERMKKYKSLGFDASNVPLRECQQFYSSRTNMRTDEYADPTRFLHRFLGRIRRAMGEDFILYGGSPTPGDGLFDMSPEDCAGFINEIAPYVDILYIRSATGDLEMNDSYAPGVDMAKALKAAGARVPLAISTPYMDLDKLEALIADGVCDMICSSHMFICNENLRDILRSGHGEDLAPCLLCHVCRGTSFTGDWMSHCTINPELGLEHRRERLKTGPAAVKKRVAVLGGGPGGMKCALWLRQRGHEPVIFEKTSELGGLLKTAKSADFKWRLDRYRRYLIAQVEKSGIELRLNTEVTPDMIEKENFDVVVAAIGGKPRLPAVEGAENARWNPITTFGSEAQFGKRVCVVGGSATSAEAAIYLARAGHEVTEICRKNIVAYDLNPIRERGNINQLSCQSGVKHIFNAATTKIEPGKVYYTAADGTEGFVECDDVVASGGMYPCCDAAAAFHDSAQEFYAIGDCAQNGDMRRAIFDAWSAAMRI